MARKVRVQYSGAMYHVMNRGALLKAVKIGADEDFEPSKVQLILTGHPLYTEVWSDQPPLMGSRSRGWRGISPTRFFTRGCSPYFRRSFCSRAFTWLACGGAGFWWPPRRRGS